MRTHEFLRLFRDAFREWSADKAPRLGAALAYYSIFAIAPLFIVAVALAGLVFGEAAAQGQLSDHIHTLVGTAAAQAIEEILAHTYQYSSGIWATALGISTLLIGAAGAFGELQDSLNTIWKVEPKPNRRWWVVLRERFLPYLMMLGVGLLLLVLLILSAVLAAIAGFLKPEALPGGLWLWGGLNALLSFGFLVVLFALIYHRVPDVRIDWADVWIGAAVTALLFTIGKYLLGLYLGLSGITSAYGAAGSLVLILLWVYYSAQIFLYGAEFTRVYAAWRGHPLEPSANAERMTAETLARQGIRLREGTMGEMTRRMTNF